MRDPETELKHRRRIDQTLLDQPMREHDVAGFEDFQFRFDPEFLDAFRHDTQVRRRVDEDGFTEIESTDIESADIGPQFLDVMQPLERLYQRGARAADRGVFLAGRKTRAFAGGQVDQHVTAGIANPFDDLAKQRRIAGSHSGLGIAHVDVHDRGARLRRIDAVAGDMLGRDRIIRMLALIVVAAADGAGQDDFVGHFHLPSNSGVRFWLNALMPSRRSAVGTVRL